MIKETLCIVLLSVCFIDFALSVPIPGASYYGSYSNPYVNSYGGYNGYQDGYYDSDIDGDGFNEVPLVTSGGPLVKEYIAPVSSISKSSLYQTHPSSSYYGNGYYGNSYYGNGYNGHNGYHGNGYGNGYGYYGGGGYGSYGPHYDKTGGYTYYKK